MIDAELPQETLEIDALQIFGAKTRSKKIKRMIPLLISKVKQFHLITLLENCSSIEKRILCDAYNNYGDFFQNRHPEHMTEVISLKLISNFFKLN